MNDSNHAEPRAAPITGRVLGEFVVEEPLGSGGFGDVYRARQLSLDRDVVIKVLRVDASLARHLERFEREARLASQLDHPYAAHVYAYGSEPDGLTWIAMELVRGTTLRDWIEHHGPMDVARFAPVFERLCEVVHTAHVAGLVHCDIKPANIMVIERAGRLLPKLLDFGVARSAASASESPVLAPELAGAPGDVSELEGDATATASGPGLAGTPAFMAPEQWSPGDAFDHRVDIYALGLVAFHALSGRAPFTGDSWRAYLDAHMSEPVPALGHPAIDRVIARAAAKDPSDRYDSATALAEAMRDATTPGDPPPRSVDAARSTRRWWPLVAGGAIAIAGSGIVLALGGGTGEAATCEPDPAVFDGRWDDARSHAVAAHLRALPGGTAVRVDRILAAFAAGRHEIERRLTATCRAAGAEQLSSAQAATRTACLERRAMRLGSIATWSLRTPHSAVAVEERAKFATADCADMVAPAIPHARADDAALWDRLALVELAPYEDRADRYAAIERDAEALGDRELEGLAASRAGDELADRDRFDDADRAQQRAYRIGLDIQAVEIQARAMTARAELAAARRDPGAAESFGQVALQLAEQPATPPAIRAAIDIRIGAIRARNRDRGAADQLRAGIGIAHTEHLTHLEIEGRTALVDTAAANDRREQARVVVRDMRALVRDAATDDQSRAYALALARLSDLAPPGTALAKHREVLALLRELYPDDHSRVVRTRIDIARDLLVRGDYEEAYRELSALLASPANPTLARHARGYLAQASCKLGRFDDCVRVLAQTIAESSKDDPDVDGLREFQIGIELELGKLDDAEHHVAALVARYEHVPAPPRDRLARLRGGYQAMLATLRGKPRAGEALARTSLDGPLTDAVRGDVLRALGDSLVAQRRWTAARDAYEQAEHVVRAAAFPEPGLARIEVELARIEAATGNRSAALARAKRASEVLEHHPGERRARERVAALVATRGGT